VSRGSAWSGRQARQGRAWQGMAGEDRNGPAWPDLDRSGRLGLMGTVGLGAVGLGMAGLGEAGEEWRGSAGMDKPGHGRNGS
jgi:hypothetical protein